MSCATKPLVWKLSRRAQQLIAWDVFGLPTGSVVSLQLEGSGPWAPMTVNPERTAVIMWVAGPDFVDPGGGVLVVPTTSHTEIRIVSGQTTIFLDGGYIELVP